MDLIGWVEAMRKKPIAERRRFTAVATIAVMAVIAAIWFALFFLGVGSATGSSPQIEISMPAFPQMPKLDPSIQGVLHKVGF